jgi:hypothetical protein
MTPTATTKFIERVRFFDNERLIAADLQAIDDFARQMRWMHNRSLHQPGVANGYAVAGDKGDREVIIQPGYALDSLGREIVLTQPYTQPVPPQAGDGQGGPAVFDLAVSYPDTLNESESRTADCTSAVPGAVRLEESPVFCWVPAFKKDDPLRVQIDSGLRIVLARVEVLNCKLNQRISVAQRRDARPGVHPFVYAATAVPTWQKTGGPFGFEIGTRIDTSAAGFRTVPGYFADMADEPSIVFNNKTIRLDVLVSIANPDVAAFDVFLLIPNLPLKAAGLDPANVETALGIPHWKIEWMGVEA